MGSPLGKSVPPERVKELVAGKIEQIDGDHTVISEETFLVVLRSGTPEHEVDQVRAQIEDILLEQVPDYHGIVEVKIDGEQS